MIQKLIDNPAAITGLIRALLIFLGTFGVALTEAQVNSTLELVGAVLTVASLALTVVTVKLTTSKTNPTLAQGTVVTVVTPEGQPNTKTKVV